MAYFQLKLNECLKYDTCCLIVLYLFYAFFNLRLVAAHDAQVVQEKGDSLGSYVRAF